jgi:hypothetical protein
LHAWASEYESIGLITLRLLPANTQPHLVSTVPDIDQHLSCRSLILPLLVKIFG